jgi:hypothetical protein
MANPNLEMYQSDSPTTEVGTVGNPIDFGYCDAGEDTELSYDILLWNDKGAALGSEDAKSIIVELLKMYLTQSETSDGSASQEFTATYIPVLEDIPVEITVDTVRWLIVSSLSGQSATAKVCTFNYTTGVLTFGDGVNGAIPTLSSDIQIVYTPDLATFGQLVYNEQWLSIKSNGTIQNEVHVGSSTPEESTKIDDDSVQVLHYPELTEVVGVWDNASKLGTNYYTSGSYDSSLGIIYLGASLTADTPYVEYKYQIKDDLQTSYSTLGLNESVALTNRIPQNNAKRVQLKITVPSTASTEGGAYIKVVLRVYYTF